MLWPAGDDVLVTVSSYGLGEAELIQVANSVNFDGERVAVQVPSGMIQVEDGSLRHSDDRDVVYLSASFVEAAVADLDEPPEGTAIYLQISTWDDLSINDVGSAQLVDLDGTTAVVVITGGPGTDLTRWVGGTVPVAPTVTPPSAYITWRADGVVFRITGPDADTIIEMARSLRPTG